MKTRKIIQIVVQGGNVQEVTANFNTDNYDVELIDLDNEPDKEYVELKQRLL